MGSLKIGDKIIITKVLQIGEEYNFLLGTVQTVQNVDWLEHIYPYRIVIENRGYFWVEGIPYSPLLVELL